MAKSLTRRRQQVGLWILFAGSAFAGGISSAILWRTGGDLFASLPASLASVALILLAVTAASEGAGQRWGTERDD